MKRLLLCLHEHLFLQMLRTVKQLNQFKMSSISLKKTITQIQAPSTLKVQSKC